MQTQKVNQQKVNKVTKMTDQQLTSAIALEITRLGLANQTKSEASAKPSQVKATKGSRTAPMVEVTAKVALPDDVKQARTKIKRDLIAMDGKIKSFIALLTDNKALLVEYFGEKKFKCAHVFKWVMGHDEKMRVDNSVPHYASFYYAWGKAFKERKQQRNYATPTIKATGSNKIVQDTLDPAIPSDAYSDAASHNEKVCFIAPKCIANLHAITAVKDGLKQRKVVTLPIEGTIMIDEEGIIHIVELTEI